MTTYEYNELEETELLRLLKEKNRLRREIAKKGGEIPREKPMPAALGEYKISLSEQIDKMKTILTGLPSGKP